jgi:hypothetical protein
VLRTQSSKVWIGFDWVGWFLDGQLLELKLSISKATLEDLHPCDQEISKFAFALLLFEALGLAK